MWNRNLLILFFVVFEERIEQKSWVQMQEHMISKTLQIIIVHIKNQKTHITNHHMRNINAKKNTELWVLILNWPKSENMMYLIVKLY